MQLKIETLCGAWMLFNEKVVLTSSSHCLLNAFKRINDNILFIFIFLHCAAY